MAREITLIKYGKRRKISILLDTVPVGDWSRAGIDKTITNVVRAAALAGFYFFATAEFGIVTALLGTVSFFAAGVTDIQFARNNYKNVDTSWW